MGAVVVPKCVSAAERLEKYASITTASSGGAPAAISTARAARVPTALRDVTTAADLGVLTSVDVCNQLGISGLTISSETNCLKISGEVSYNFGYGVWNTASDADTGAFKRMWGAYGNTPDDSTPQVFTPDGPGPQQFNTVHGVKVSNDFARAH